MPIAQSNPYGYDIVNEIPIGDGKYLSLKEKDQSVQIRLVSMPVYIKRYWITSPSGKKQPVIVEKGQPDPYGGKDVPVGERLDADYRFGWIVIDREGNQVKIFQASKSVAFKIKAVSELTDKLGNIIWGDPNGYDLLITRTEQKGPNYYSLDALPHTRTPVTPEEQKMVVDANIDLLAEMKGSRKAKSSSHNTASPAGLETVPQQRQNNVVQQQPQVQPQQVQPQEQTQQVQPQQLQPQGQTQQVQPQVQPQYQVQTQPQAQNVQATANPVGNEFEIPDDDDDEDAIPF